MIAYASKNAARRGLSATYSPDSAHPGIMPTNVILDIAREYQSGDAEFETLEALYTLHRLWNEYQSPDIGTSPIDAWDAGDEIPLYNDVIVHLEELNADVAASMVVHATRVMLRRLRLIESLEAAA